MRNAIPFVASALAAVAPTPLLAHGGHEAAGAGVLHAAVHLLPALVPVTLLVVALVWASARWIGSPDGA